MALSDRERRTVMGGALVVALGVLLVRGVLPLAAHWQRQGARLSAARSRVARAEGLLQQADTLAALADALERRLAESPRRLAHGPSAAVAASALEGLLQGATEASGAQLQQLSLEPPAAGEGDGALPEIRGTVSAVGDIQGLAQLLAQLANGPRPVRVARLTVQHNPALRGAPDVLQWTVGVRVPVVVP